jgi:hypothetical protein
MRVLVAGRCCYARAVLVPVLRAADPIDEKLRRWPTAGSRRRAPPARDTFTHGPRRLTARPATIVPLREVAVEERQDDVRLPPHPRAWCYSPRCPHQDAVAAWSGAYGG